MPRFLAGLCMVALVTGCSWPTPSVRTPSVHEQLGEDPPEFPPVGPVRLMLYDKPGISGRCVLIIHPVDGADRRQVQVWNLPPYICGKEAK